MIRIVSLLLSFALVSGQTLFAADRTLAAEGNLVAHTETGDKLLSHWQLWHLSNGEYEVVDTSLLHASFVQIFRFNSQFLPIGYTKKFGPIQTISCQYGSKELRCSAESSEGSRSTASIPAKLPYVFIGEFYDLDFVWFMTGVVRLSSQDGTKDGVVNVYVLTSGAKSPDIRLRPDKPMKIVFAGEETEEVMGKTQVVRKYEWGSKVLRVTSEGLVATLSGKSNPAIGWGISNYKEYKPWGPNR